MKRKIYTLEKYLARKATKTFIHQTITRDNSVLQNIDKERNIFCNDILFPDLYYIALQRREEVPSYFQRCGEYL